MAYTKKYAALLATDATQWKTFTPKRGGRENMSLYYSSKSGSDSTSSSNNNTQKRTIVPFPGMVIDSSQDAQTLDLMATLKAINPQVNTLTVQEILYKNIFGLRTSELRQLLRLPFEASIRAHLSTLGLSYLQTAEEALRLYVSSESGALSPEKIYDMAGVVGRTIGCQAYDISKNLKVNLVTGERR